MEALSILAPRGAFQVSTHLDSDVGFCYMLRRKRGRRKRWGLSDPIHSSNGSCASYFARDSGGLVCGFSVGCSKVRFLSFCEPKMRSLCASFVLTLASEEEAVGGEGFSEEVALETMESESVEIASANLHQAERDENEINSTAEEEEEPKVAVLKEKNLNFGREGVSGSNSRIDVRALAKSLWDCKTADDVEDVFNSLGELLPPPVYSSLIRGFGIDKKLGSAYALIEWLKRKGKETGSASVGPNLFIYNSLLGALKQTGQFEEVDRVMEEMVEQGILPNIVTYNSLMSICVEQGRPSKALDVLDSIEKKGLSPSPVTYSTALLAYWKMEDVLGALGFYVDLRDKYRKGEIGKEGDDEDWEDEFVKLENFTIRICYQVMRQWLVKRDDPTTSIMKLLTNMDKVQVLPSRVEYEKLIWACTKEGHYTVARELYARIREMDTGISLSVCNHVIWLMGKAKKWWAALEIYEELLDKGPKPNNLSYELIMSHFNILLSAASKRGIWRWGVRLINKMQDKGLKPGSREWNAVLVACSKASESTTAVEIFRRMIEQGEKPNILSYGALLSALEKGKLYDEAFRVWEHMLKVGIKPNLYAYTILASIYIAKGEPEKVDSVIHDMASSGVEPTVITFNAIISGCARSNLGSTAFEWFHRMNVRNITPNEVTYEMLIEALARDDKPRLAFELYLRARNEGLQLSPKAYDAVLESCQVYGPSMDISSIGPRPPDKRKIISRKTSSDSGNLADVARRGKPFEREEMLHG